MPSAKQQPSNIKHDVGIRPNVCKLTFGPPCTRGPKVSLHTLGLIPTSCFILEGCLKIFALILHVLNCKICNI